MFHFQTFHSQDDRPTLVAMVEDINKIAHIMKELETLGKQEYIKIRK